MTLNLQLETKTARANLAALAADIGALKTQLTSFSGGKGFENTLTKLSAFKGIEATTVASLNQLASAMQAASNAAAVTNNISKSLNALARVRVDAVAQNIERVSKALASLRIPPTVERFAAVISNIAQASSQATASVRQLGSALNSVRMPAGLNNTSSAFTRINSAAREASGGLVSLRSVSSGVSNTLAGFGVVLGAFGFAQFITSTYQATRAIDTFRVAIRAGLGDTASTQLVGQELAFVEKIALKTATSISTLAQGYLKYSTAARLSGVETENIHKAFEAVAVTARVMGLSADNVSGTFEALAQMASKGRVSMEELRQQLGDRLVGSLQLMAKGLGYASDDLNEFFKAISKGQIGATEGIDALAEQLLATYGAELPAAMRTSAASFGMFQLGVERLQIAFGGTFFDAFKDSLMDLARTINSPEFITGARQFGAVLGSVMNGVINIVHLVINNFDVLKYALMAMASVQVAGIVNSWVTSLAVAGRVATMTAANLGALVVASARLGFISEVLIGLRAAFASLGAAAIAFGVSLSPLTLAMLGIGAAVAVAVIAYNNWESITTALSSAMQGFVSTLSAVGAAIASVIPDWVISAFQTLVGWVLQAVKAMFPLVEIINLVSMAWNALVPSANAAELAMKAVNDTAKWLSGSASSADSSVEGLSGSLSQSSGAANSAASSYRNAASAAYDYASAANVAADAAENLSQAESAAIQGASIRKAWSQTEADQRSHQYDVWTAADEARSAGVDPSKVINTLSSSWAGGGIVGGYNPRRRIAVPTSAFLNAPHFAGGGLSDGGIPAVLHPNEAVVPLTGGGQIPVANMSTGQGSLLLLKPLQQMVDYQRQTKTEVSRVWEAVTTQTVLMKNALDRSESYLSHIDNQRLPDIVKALANLQSYGGGSYSSGGYSGGSGLGLGGGGSSSIEEQLGLELDRYLAQIQASAAATNMTQGILGGTTMVGGKVYATGSPAHKQAVAQVQAADVARIKAEVAAGYYTQDQLAQLLKTYQNNQIAASGARYADGSPNAYKDATGGFSAILHPDEAVIPLPDGRSVPVDMSGFMDRVSSMVNDGDARTAATSEARSSRPSGSGGNVINNTFHIVINAKDAASFSSSKDQVMRDLQKDLDRATRRIGRTSDIDDPTKRA